MKPLLPTVALLASAHLLLADVDVAPFINKQIKELNRQITTDLASGKLTQADADGLKREVASVKAVEDSEPSLTPATRRDMREKLSGIAQDLKRKEAQTKALASPSPSATPKS